MSVEALVEICKNEFSKGKEPDYEKVSGFFNKLIMENNQINMSDSIRAYIPKIAQLHDGSLIPALTKCINGLSPMHLVPDLQLSKSESSLISTSRSHRTARTAPRHYPSTPKSRDNLTTRQGQADEELSEIIQSLPVRNLNVHSKTPKSARFITPRPKIIVPKKMIPPLNQTGSNILPTLYINNHSDYFLCKQDTDSSPELKVVPPDYPKQLIGNEYSIMSSQCVVTVDDSGHSTAIPLSRFIKLQEKEIIVSGMEFRSKLAYQMFYKWRLRCATQRFEKIIDFYNERYDISGPGFLSLQDELHSHIIDVLNTFSVLGVNFDKYPDDVEFDEIRKEESISLSFVEEKINILKDECNHELEAFFRQVRAAQMLMQLNFEELYSLNALPASLQQYSSDLKWKLPSLWRQKMREEQIKKERRLSTERLEYISKFFTRIRALYSGLLLLQCKDIIVSFLSRFMMHFPKKRRTLKLCAVFQESNLILTPSLDQFLSWVKESVSSFSQVFLNESNHISINVVTDIFPDYSFKISTSVGSLHNYKDYSETEKRAYSSITDTFHFFEKELKKYADNIKSLSEILSKSERVTDLRDIKVVPETITDLVRATRELSKWPKNLYHHLPGGDTATDFVVDLKSAEGEAKKRLDEGVHHFKERLIKEINCNIFTDIQHNFTLTKDHSITAEECFNIEKDIILFSFLCDKLCDAWPDVQGDVKPSFDTILKMYRDLQQRTHRTHSSVAMDLNQSAEKLGLSPVPVLEDEEYEEETEYEYEEEED